MKKRIVVIALIGTMLAGCGDIDIFDTSGVSSTQTQSTGSGTAAGRSHLPEDPEAGLSEEEIERISKTLTEKVPEVKPAVGELKSAAADGVTADIEVEVEDIFSGNTAVWDSYYNIWHMVLYQGMDVSRQINYKGYAKDANGEWYNFISFSVPAGTIDGITEREITANTMKDYVYDLEINPEIYNN